MDHHVTWFLLINQYLQNILLGLLESRWSPQKDENYCVKWCGMGWIPQTPCGVHGVHLESRWNPGGNRQKFGWVLRGLFLLSLILLFFLCYLLSFIVWFFFLSFILRNLDYLCYLLEITIMLIKVLVYKVVSYNRNCSLALLKYTLHLISR